MAERVVHEAYAFACLRCGAGWEAAYEISHVTGINGEVKPVYRTKGQVVPSPLSQPHCDHCDGHDVRVLRSGRVARVPSMHYNGVV